MKREVIEFCATDGMILNGYINKCKKNTNKLLIEIHGMTSNCFKKREKIIAQKVESLDVDTICFNNRGSEIIRYAKKIDETKMLVGTSYEDIEESYYDIVVAIKYALDLGYTEIYLQGHSLGSSKIVYVYNELKKENNPVLENIKGILLLSLVDLTDSFNEYLTPEIIKYADQKEKEGKLLELMPNASFMHLISVKTFLRYTKYNEKIDFAKYYDKNNEFKELNNIDVPLFMRWGNNGELIKQDAKELVKFLREKIKYEIADELGLKEKVDEYGWAGLTAEETGRIGGIMTKRKKELKIPTNDEILGRK